MEGSFHSLIGDFTYIDPNKMEMKLEEEKGYSCCLTQTFCSPDV
jgi:hypothetical protein